MNYRTQVRNTFNYELYFENEIIEHSYVTYLITNYILRTKRMEKYTENTHTDMFENLLFGYVKFVRYLLIKSKRMPSANMHFI